MKISVILGHPYKHSLNAAIAEIIVKTLKSSGHDVRFHDLCREHFDPAVAVIVRYHTFPEDESPSPAPEQSATRAPSGETTTQAAATPSKAAETSPSTPTTSITMTFTFRPRTLRAMYPSERTCTLSLRLENMTQYQVTSS